jgi:hypothetical protein
VIPSYSDYIRQYIHGRGRPSPPAPGEHHFVSAYLVPKLFAIDGRVPDYINPDGTKSILGDIVYYQDGRHHFGIEVKLGTVRLTKLEFNNWIVEADLKHWPHLFIGVGKCAVGMATWEAFRRSYLSAIQEKTPGWLPQEIPSGYGKTISVDRLIQYLQPEDRFPWVTDPSEVVNWESEFTNALRRQLALAAR